MSTAFVDEERSAPEQVASRIAVASTSLSPTPYRVQTTRSPRLELLGLSSRYSNEVTCGYGKEHWNYHIILGYIRGI